MSLISITIEFIVPEVGATDYEIKDWLEIMIGYRSESRFDNNPLRGHVLEVNKIAYNNDLVFSQSPKISKEEK